jgi:hypothetical protein
MAVEHACLLVDIVLLVDLRKVRAEILRHCLVIVAAITEGGNAENRSFRSDQHPNQKWRAGDATHYFFNRTPLSSLVRRMSVLFRKSTRWTLARSRFEQICVKSCSESSILFVFGSSSRYCRGCAAASTHTDMHDISIPSLQLRLECGRT